jgi:hypothetical protein
MASRALVSSKPTTPGMVVVPMQIVKATCVPNDACWPVAGAEPTTRPSLAGAQLVV